MLDYEQMTFKQKAFQLRKQIFLYHRQCTYRGEASPRVSAEQKLSERSHRPVGFEVVIGFLQRTCYPARLKGILLLFRTHFNYVLQHTTYKRKW